MSDETLIRMLEEAAGRVPDSPAPVGEVLRHGHATVRRRRGWAVAGAVAAVLVVGGGVALGNHPGGGSGVTSSGVATASDGASAQVGRGDRTTQGTSPQSSTVGTPAEGDTVTPAAPAGTRWVGFEQVMVAVPADWPMRAGQVCPDTHATYVTVLPAGAGVVNCARIPAPAAGSDRLVLAPAGSDAASALACDPGVPEHCSATAVVDGVAISFDSSDQHAAEVWRQLQDSITALPDGAVAVPWAGGGTYVQPDVGELATALREVGLRVALGTGADGRTVSTDPEPGSVVSPGRLVTIVDARTSSPQGTMEGRLVWAGGPAGVSPRAHQGTIHIVGTADDGVGVDQFVPTDRTGHWAYVVDAGTYTVTGTSTGFGLAGGTQDACVADGPARVTPEHSTTVTVTCSLR